MADIENITEWRGKELLDRDGEKIGKLQDVYVDTDTDDPVFGSVKEGLIGKHLTFVPVDGATASPDGLRVVVSKEQVKDAPNIDQDGELEPAGETELYEHYGLAYTPLRPRLYAAVDRKRPAACQALISANAMNTESEQPAVIEKLQRRRKTHHEHGRIYRTAWVITGFIVIAGGVAMIALPGPAFIVIPLGLAMLSFEFSWAQRALDKGVSGGMEVKDRGVQASSRQKLLGVIALILAAAAAVAMAILIL